MGNDGMWLGLYSFQTWKKPTGSSWTNRLLSIVYLHNQSPHMGDWLCEGAKVTVCFALLNRLKAETERCRSALFAPLFYTFLISDFSRKSILEHETFFSFAPHHNQSNTCTLIVFFFRLLYRVVLECYIYGFEKASDFLIGVPKIFTCQNHISTAGGIWPYVTSK